MDSTTFECRELEEWLRAPYVVFMSQVEWPSGVRIPPVMPTRVFNAKMQSESDWLWGQIYGREKQLGGNA